MLFLVRSLSAAYPYKWLQEIRESFEPSCGTEVECEYHSIMGLIIQHIILDVLINALFVDGVYSSVAVQHIKSNA